ncbi:tRNA-queuosine alpha-mannosyltransferase domain-containing protein [Pseudohongiella nitratireducens]|uniref:tRNA-queuosine alpha-mannosyltransferase domain-containing protein n=1 Tax=Pseudohongiella nitratireducens TaxID=1768907 RepID=UPI0030EDA23A|tara:strand:+ start:2066 stop:3379 length:1314 start_codon:yes stop_codon:yes gene_type:complete
MTVPHPAKKPAARARTVRRQILLLSPYDAYSHQQWRLTLVAMFPEFDWTVLTLPPRYFSWRVRGNSLSWAFEQQDILRRRFDLLVCTSLTDLSGLRGLVPSLTAIPTLVYFHENQFAYPANGMKTGPNDKPSKTSNRGEPKSAQNIPAESVEAAMLSIYSALCADQVLFNSQWNFQSFLSGCEQLLRKLPDHVPAGICQLMARKSEVQPVPLPDSLFEAALSARAPDAQGSPLMPPATLTPHVQSFHPTDTSPLEIVWNHRHEFDKGPALLLAIVQRLVQSNLPFRLHLLGQRFRQRPDEFAELDSLLESHYQSQQITPGINRWLENRNDYLQQLSEADIVLSTALHDFQGLSVQEACIMGCLPVVPDALAYPEFIPPDYRYDNSGVIEQQAASATERILGIVAARQASSALPAVDLTAVRASHRRADWLDHLNKLL